MEVFVDLLDLDIVRKQHLDCFLVAVEVTVATTLLVLLVMVQMETCCHHHQILVSCL